MSVSKFNPDRFKHKDKVHDVDSELMRTAIKIQMPSRKSSDRFIPAFPLTFLQQLLPAGDALPILLIAMTEMRMKDMSEVSLGPGLWASIGNPSRRIRSRLLQQIMKLPSSVCTLEKRSGRPYLLHIGADWPLKKIAYTHNLG